MGYLSILSCSFIPQFMCHHGLVGIGFTLYVIIQTTLFLRLLQSGSQGPLLVGSHVPLTYAARVQLFGSCFVLFEHFLTFWHYKMLQIHQTSCPSFKINHFSRSPGLFYLKTGRTQIWVLSALTPWVSQLLGSSSCWRKKICVYQPVRMHKSINV